MKYRAVFEIPAMVQVTLEIPDAESMEAGLVQAFDMVHRVRPHEATAVSLNLDQAKNISFDKLASECTDEHNHRAD